MKKMYAITAVIMLLFASFKGGAQTLTINGTTLTSSSILFSNTLMNTTAVIPFTVTGASLSPAAGSITVTGTADFLVSLSAGTGFNTSVSIPYTSNALAATTVYVSFKPTSASQLTGSISIAGGGATTRNVAVTGDGGISTFGASSLTLYRTKTGSTSGNWSAAGTWETSSDGGTNWAAAIAAPTGNENIYIQGGFNVTLDGSASINNITGYLKNNGVITQTATASQTSVAGGGATTGSNTLTLSASNSFIAVGQLMNAPSNTGFPSGLQVTAVSGTTVTLSQPANGNMTAATAPTFSFYGKYFTFTSGTYEHAQDGGNIPVSIWNASSTCLVSGAIFTAPGVSGNCQNFGNFTWDCTNQTNASLTMNWVGLTITGNVNFKNTGTANIGGGNNSGSVRISSSGPLGPSTVITSVPITINGDLTLGTATTKGNATITGSSGAQVYNILIKGNVTIGGGTAASTFSVSSGSGGVGILTLPGTTNTGNITMGTGAALNGSNASKIIFAKAGTQTFTGSSNSSITWEIASGTTLNAGSSTMAGSGFIINSGATLIDSISTFAGGNITTTNKLINAGANFILCGTAAQTLAFPAASAVVACNSTTATTNNANVILSYPNSNIAVGQTVTGTGVTAGTTVLSVTGTPVTSVTLSANASLAANALLTFSNAAVTNQAINNLTLNNPTSVTIGSGVSVNGNMIASAGSVLIAPAGSLSNGATSVIDFNNRPVTIQSTSAGTGSIGAVSGTITSATNVTVERYIPSSSRKSYVMVTSPVSGSTIKAGWQEAGATIANYGTHITGPTGTSTSDGFDATSASGFASIFTYNDGNLVGSKWVGLTNTNLNNLAAGKGYLLYVRGDRNEARYTTGTSNNTTLRATGTITTGDFTPVPTTVDSAFNLVANPYPCAITWSALTKSNLANSFYVYDPNLAVFVTSDGVNVSPNTSKQQANVIQSGQAFFIRKSSGVPSITFTEASKTTAATTTSATTVFGEEAPASQLNINVYNKANELADGVVALFGNNYKAGLGKEDAAKMDNFNETFSLTRNNNRLSIEGRPMVKGNDTLFFAMNNFSKKEYVLKIDGSNFSEANATLLDNYTGTKTALDLAGITAYSFTVNGDAASASSDRFMITFGSTATIAAGETTDNNNSLFVKVGPNPMSNQLQVNFKTATTENTVIKIINSLGQTVKTVNAGKVNAGNISIPTGSLAGGLYTVQLISGDKKIASQKVVKE